MAAQAHGEPRSSNLRSGLQPLLCFTYALRVFGQGGNAAATGIPFDARNNVLRALVDWVEAGTAPEYIEGTRFVNDTVALGVDFTRKHCRYV